MQLCSGIDENAVGACAQLVFAPIDESFADDAFLLPSGFRVIPLDAKTVSNFAYISLISLCQSIELYLLVCKSFVILTTVVLE